MKKILTIFLTLAVMLTAAACGAKEEGTESSPAPSSAAEESSSEASLPEPGPVPTEVGGEGLALMEQMTAALEGTGDYADNPTASIETSEGTIRVRLFPKEAPKAVENFLTHAREGYYDGLTFHRVINDFMLQGGDPNGDGTGGESIWGGPFEDEFSPVLRNFRGALSMANSGANTNGSQFFIVQRKDALSGMGLSDYLLNLYMNDQVSGRAAGRSPKWRRAASRGGGSTRGSTSSTASLTANMRRESRRITRTRSSRRSKNMRRWAARPTSTMCTRCSAM